MKIVYILSWLLFFTMTTEYAITRQTSCPDLTQKGLYKSIIISVAGSHIRSTPSSFSMQRRHSSPNLHTPVKTNKILKEMPHQSGPSQKNLPAKTTRSFTASHKKPQLAYLALYKEFKNKLDTFLVAQNSSFDDVIKQLESLSQDVLTWLSTQQPHPYTPIFKKLITEIHDARLEQLEHKHRMLNAQNMLSYALEKNPLSITQNLQLVQAAKREATDLASIYPTKFERFQVVAQLKKQAESQERTLEVLSKIDFTTLDLEDID